MTSSQEVSRPAMFGRDDVLDRLHEHLVAACSGAGRLVWVCGEAGIGKSRLLDEVDALARRAGARVLHATGWEDPGTPPFWLWAQVLRDALGRQHPAEALAAWGPRAGAALGLLPEHLPGGPSGDGAASAFAPASARFPLFDAVSAVLESLAEASPLVLLLDDLHWTDPGSLRLLLFLTSSLARRKVLLVAAWREHEVPSGSPLTSVAAEVAARADVLTLGGLDPGDVARILRAHGAVEVDDIQAGRLRDRTAGNPLFLAELARLSRERGLVGALGQVPPAARTVIQRRLARVSQPCHDLLAVLAVAGPDTSTDVLARLGGLATRDLAAVLDEAVAAHLAVRQAGRIELSHPLVRDALVDLLPAVRARELHLRLARLREPAMAADPAVTAEVAHHLLRALPLGDPDRVVSVTEQAALVAYRAQAYEESGRHYEEVLALVAADDPRRPPLLLGLGRAMLAAGDHERGRAAYQEAAKLFRARADFEGLARAALGLGSGLAGFEVRLWDQAQLDLLDEALARLPRNDSELRADLLARLSVAVSFTERAAEGPTLAEEALAMARRTRSGPTVARALAAHCDAIAGPEHAPRRVRESGEVVRLAREAGDRELQLLGLRLRVVALLELGRLAEARDDVRAFARVAEQVGQPLYSWYVPLWRGFEAHRVGDLPRLEACAEEVARVGAQAESRNAATLAFVQHMWVAMERLQHDRAVAEMTDLLESLAEVAPDGGLLIGLTAGQPERVRSQLRERVAELLRRLPVDAEYIANLCHLAGGLWHGREPASCAAPVYEALLPYADRISIDGIAAGTHGSVARFLGVLAALQGRIDKAERHFEHALVANTAAGCELALAHTRWMYAEVLGLRGAGADASRRRSLLEEALADYRRMGISERVDLVTSLLSPGANGSPGTTDVPDAVPEAGRFRRAGRLWEVSYRGRTAALPHVKGMGDLAVLLARPGSEVHALDLVGGPRSPGREGTRPDGTTLGGAPGDLGEVVDRTAREAYRRRLAELDAELAGADALGDADLAARAEAERAALVGELAAAYGLGGRPRRAGDPAERARTTVTWRIRDAIRRIEADHPALGRHLRVSVRTGVFCCYAPEQEQRWEV